MASTLKMGGLAGDSSREPARGTNVPNADTKKSQPTDAVGAEIPVSVHASRYSAASRGLGKNLSPVHEETRTVIVFPQGAVVRLSSMLEVGELVVLTNKQNGLDVICRVTNVKAQPGIQNYVNLEFTQRAPNFWGESSPGIKPTESESVSSSAAALESESASEAKPIHIAEPPKAAVRELPAPISGEIASVKSEQEPESGSTSAGLPPTWLEIGSKSAPSKETRPPILPSSIAVMPSMTAAQYDKPESEHQSSSKKILLIAIAAVVLLAIGAVGGTLLMRQNRAANSAAEAPAVPATVSTPSAPPIEAVPSPAAPATATQPAVKPAAPVVLASDVAKSNQPVVTPAVPAPTTVASTADSAKQATPPENKLKIGKISAPVAKSKIAAAAVEPPPSLPLPGAVGSASDNLLNASLRNGLPAPPQPAAPSPVKGGQIIQPKLLASSRAVYPPQARSQRIEGDVIVDALVDATGSVGTMRVVSGHPLLQKAALDALRTWKYEPARLNGQAIPVNIRVSISFRLQ